MLSVKTETRGSWIPGRGLRPPYQVRGRLARNDGLVSFVIPVLRQAQDRLRRASSFLRLDSGSRAARPE
jgi:hypothetical protein